MATRQKKKKLQTRDLRRRPLTLRRYPDPVLRQETTCVIMFDGHLERFLYDMLRFMKDRKGIGLAAPQVGVLQRIIVADIYGGPLSLANPEIVTREGFDTMAEGCLSLPGVLVEVPRNTCIEVAGQDARGHHVEFEAKGLLARVLQHEIDHLDGRLISDYECADPPNVA